MSDVENIARKIPVAWAAGALTAGLTLLGPAAWAVRGRSSQVFAPSVYKGAGERRAIALTFDDGPSPGTMELLDILKQHDVKATFFQCGANVERHPAIARAVREAGHEIGNHTYTHPRLCPQLGWRPGMLSRAEIFEEFAHTQAVIEAATGARPRLLRAPYGLRWFGLREVQRQFGLLGVMWTVIGHDWEWEAAAIAKLVLGKSGPGGIICLHDGRDVRANPDIGETLKAVREIVPVLLGKGYVFETVSEMVGAGGS